MQLAGQREFAARTLERETKSLMQIDAALKRIEDGEFGICLDCEEPISRKRLAAVPWAAYCLHCQEMHDAEEPEIYCRAETGCISVFVEPNHPRLENDTMPCELSTGASS